MRLSELVASGSKSSKSAPKPTPLLAVATLHLVDDDAAAGQDQERGDEEGAHEPRLRGIGADVAREVAMLAGGGPVW